jgi:deoxyribonuclease-4
VLIGAHVSSAGGIHRAIDRIEAIGGDSVQLFTQSPRMWRQTAHDPASLERFRERRAEAGIGYALCHALYLINLASPDPALHARSEAALVATLGVARELEADVVLHVGSHLGSGFDAGVERALPPLRRALELTTPTTWLLLENSAGAGGTIGRDLDELLTIADLLGQPPELGFCLDSCHLWVSGVDVTDPATVDAVLRQLDRGAGIERLRALHINDAATPLGSNRDHHANVGDGVMGKGLAAFLGHPFVQGLPAILETPGPDGHGPDARQVSRLRRLHKRGLER